MITKITDENTVKEIREVLDFIAEKEGTEVSILIRKDISGRFVNWCNNRIISIKDLPDYIAEHTKPEPDYDEILNNLEAQKKIIKAMPIQDILDEICRRTK